MSTIDIDVSTIVGLSLGSLALSLLLYVWTALALSALFRKSGEAGWKGWVPILNLLVLLGLGGQSGWLLLFLLAPGIGAVILWVFLVIAAYRINVAFGHGAGMTVLAAVSLPIWATMLGFGSARWLGTGIRSPKADPALMIGRSGSSQPAGLPATPQAFAPDPRGNERAGAPSARWSGESWPTPAPAASDALAARPPMSSPPVPAAPTPAAPPAAAPLSAAPLSAATHAWAAENLRIESQPEAASDVVPEPMLSRFLHVDPDAVQREHDGPVTVAPPVTRVPMTSSARARTGEEPWAPAQWSPDAADDESAPYESSGEVSAIAGAPEVGSPRSARTSVSAKHPHPEIPDEAFDETVVTRRRRPAWSLVPPAGSAVPIGAEIVIVGRKPAADAAFPGAQLVSVDDGTVSKTHARLELRDDRWYITDLGSTNGVLFATLMGTEVEAPPGVEVEAGDRFFLGDAEVRLQRGDG